MGVDGGCDKALRRVLEDTASRLTWARLVCWLVRDDEAPVLLLLAFFDWVVSYVEDCVFDVVRVKKRRRRPYLTPPCDRFAVLRMRRLRRAGGVAHCGSRAIFDQLPLTVKVSFSVGGAMGLLSTVFPRQTRVTLLGWLDSGRLM
jgi:hypothetical protein